MKKHNVSYKDIDRVVQDEGFALPPFELTDSVGFDVTLHTIKGHFSDSDSYREYTDFSKYLEKNIKEGYLGKKSGRGFYVYGKGSDGSPEEKANYMDPRIRNIIAKSLRESYILPCIDLVRNSGIDAEELDEAFCELNQSDKGPVRLAVEMGIISLSDIGKH
jgi:3-hydroxyacyl-CoA dehydrogenase